MAISLIDPKTGQVYEAADEAAAKAQQQAYGLELATPEQVAHYDAVKAQSEQPFAGRARAAGTAALATGARLVEGISSAIEGATGFGTAPGLVPEQGSETTAEAIAPSAFTPEAEAAREAFPGSALAGAAAPAVGLGVALAPVSGGSSLGLLATEGVVGGTLGEASEAALTGRPMTAEGVLKNGALGLALAGAGIGLGAAYRAALRGGSVLVDSAEKAIASRLPRAIVDAGEDLADPEVAARASGVVQKQTEETLRKLDAAVDRARAPVANNPVAQREALEAAAQGLEYSAPEISAELKRLARLNGKMRFEGLRQIQGATPEVQATVDALLDDASLWGQKAVDHARAVGAAKAARGGSPAGFAEAVRGVDDPTVQRLVGELDSHLDAAGSIDAARAFAPARPKRSVGAAAGELSGTEYDDAIREISDGKLKPEAVQVVADIAPGKRALMAHDVADSLNTVDEILKQDVSFGTKLEDFAEGAKRLTDEQIEKQVGWVSEQAARGRQIADEIETARQAALTGEGVAYDTKGLGQDAISKIRTGLSRIEAATDPGIRNMEADLFKREVDGLVKRVGGSRTLDEGTQHWLMERLRPYADSLRDGLQDPELFGRNADLQRAVNAGWHQLIDPYTRVQRQLSELLGREYGQIGAAAVNRRANAGAIERTMATNKGLEFHKDLQEALDGLEQLANARAEHGLSKLDRIDEMRAALDNIRNQYNTATLLRVAEKKAGVPARLSTGELAGDVGLDVLGMVSPRAASAARFAQSVKKAAKASKTVDLTELEGTATGRVIQGNLKRFATTQKELLSDTGFSREMLPGLLRSALTKLGATVAGGAGLIGALGYSDDASAAELIQNEADADLEATARALSDADYAERYIRRAGDAPGTLERFQGPHATVLQAYAEQRAVLEALARDPEALIDQLTKAFGDLPDELSSAVGAKAFQVAQYLQSKLPPVRGASVTRPAGLPPSALEVRKFALQFMAATDPSTVFDDAKRGRLRHEQVDTLRELYPEQYEALRSKTLVAMGNGKASVVQRQRADLLFDYGGALDPAFSKRLAAIAAKAYQDQDQSSKPRALTSTRLPAATRPGGLNALSLGAAAPAAQ